MLVVNLLLSYAASVYLGSFQMICQGLNEIEISETMLSECDSKIAVDDAHSFDPPQKEKRTFIHRCLLSYQEAPRSAGSPTIRKGESKSGHFPVFNGDKEKVVIVHGVVPERSIRINGIDTVNEEHPLIPKNILEVE
ncbi:hypothetical protein VNO80_09442 [Phaseolus coccineus]|uniref:Uncharacterized protein n=1 Tax=Phaseolus coccineus TaxID=3886 RepID=A0AAN9R9J3_PHACN